MEIWRGWYPFEGRSRWRMSLLSEEVIVLEVTQSPLSWEVKVCLADWMGVNGRALKRSAVRRRARREVAEQMMANTLFFIKST